ncbi:DDB1- and CUL4-associated factor homolog 1 [Zea mays]|uniref:DDB1-and CUL4-associated factor homolog 1 n=3 Tax=Zea mays TaxID=4577 RepID=A0A1D6E583_MAIZE|nr:DDB1- and CUL4-associated factor homolog 1 [Zea mays]
MAESEDATAAEPGSGPPHEDEDALLARAHTVISRIIDRELDPNPRLLHTLATMCELHEARYLELRSADTMFNSTNTRTAFTIGKLANLLRDNDEFYELVFCKFLSDTSYSVAVRAATARLLLSCHPAWTPPYPHVFEDSIIDNIKKWVTEDPEASNECKWKYLGNNKPTDAEMLRTYGIGLLAMALCSGQLIEDVLTLGVSAKLMRYLRIRVLGDASSSQRDANHPQDTKHPWGGDDSRGKSRLSQDGSRLDGTRVGYGMLTNPTAEKNNEPCVGMMQAYGARSLDDSFASLDDSDVPEADWTNDRSYSTRVCDTKSKHGERNSVTRLLKDEEVSENGELLKRKLNRAPSRLRVKGKAGDSLPECEMTPLSPTSGLRIGGQATRDRNVARVDDPKEATDVNNRLFNTISKEEYEDRFRDCIIGLKDISDIVLKAVRAAEAEARSANAPDEAVKAAGDAAAELVKFAALEVWKSENNSDAVVVVAEKAASAVVEAALSISVSRSANQVGEERAMEEAVQTSEDQDLENFVISDKAQLLQLRENYSIQCLQILGEYVEALGPVLHEKGVDVCLTLLQRSMKNQEGCDHFAQLLDVLKLVCALAAHRKFAALFVDRGGIQKIVSMPRVTQTYMGLSACLFTFGSLQSTIERVCALSSDTLDSVVELALLLLECPQDLARKNVAIFFAAAFVFKAVLDLFDARNGMQKLLDILCGCASGRSGSNSGGAGSSNVNQGNDRSPAEVLTASEKQVAYHTCVALRQYFRAHLLQLVDSIRPSKSIRSIARNTSSARAGCKPFDISNEAMDAIFCQIQRDRKLGLALVRACWLALDKFVASNGHMTMLELCKFQAHGDRYLRDLTQYAIGVLHIITLMPQPHVRKSIVQGTLSNNRAGMAVLLDTVKSLDYIDHEVICPALNVLVNLVCPPPSISNKPLSSSNQQPAAAQALASESREKNFEKTISDRNLLTNLGESRERSGDGNPAEKNNTLHQGTPSTPVVPSGVVGDRRIMLGVGGGGPGLAAQLEQGYRQAREVVRANNGIKILLQLLGSRMVTHPVAIDSIRALACRVLLGLARDDTIAHILTKLQVGKKLSELIRDISAQTSGGDSGRWQTELTQVAIELIGVLTNSGKETTLAATDAAAPALRRIERAGIAAAAPISYHSRELMQLIHEHLLGSGFAATAAMLQKEAGLAPLPLTAAVLPAHQVAALEASSVQQQWPSGHVQGFLSDKINTSTYQSAQRSDPKLPSSKKKALAFSSSFSRRARSPHPSNILKSPVPIAADTGDAEMLNKAPLSLPLKRNFVDVKDISFASASKRLAITDQIYQSSAFQTPAPTRKGLSVSVDSPTSSHCGWTNFNNAFTENLDNSQGTPGALTTTALPGVNDQQSGNLERMTLDSLVVQYLKHQHRQCPAPVTTLPPLSLLHPHVCPEPSRSLSAPANIAARVGSREISRQFSGIQIPRRDRHFIYSRFKQCRVCRDEASLLTCLTFLGDAARVVAGNHTGELRIFDCNTANLLETQTCHQHLVTMMESTYTGGIEMILTSSLNEVKIWDAFSVSAGPLHTFDDCKSARFNHYGTSFAALSTDTAQREVQLYDVQTYTLATRLPDNTSSSGSGRGYVQPIIHFSPSDTMLLWNGVLWDTRQPNPVHQFDQFTDYCGGGFHPAGNEVFFSLEPC